MLARVNVRVGLGHRVLRCHEVLDGVHAAPLPREQRLPARRIVHLQARVDRYEAGGVHERESGRFVAEMVEAVVPAGVQDACRRHVPDSGGSLQVLAEVAGVEADRRHHVAPLLCPVGRHLEHRVVDGVHDRHVRVVVGRRFRRRAPPEPRVDADGRFVIRRDGVERRVEQDGEVAEDDRRVVEPGRHVGPQPRNDVGQNDVAHRVVMAHAEGPLHVGNLEPLAAVGLRRHGRHLRRSASGDREHHAYDDDHDGKDPWSFEHSAEHPGRWRWSGWSVEGLQYPAPANLA